MFIATEQTPNPASLKFLPGCEVMTRGTAQFSNRDETGPSPLAKRLFQVAGVAGVFLGRDFVTVTKSEEQPWEALKPVIMGVIMEHFMNGLPVIEGEADDIPQHKSTAGEHDGDIVVQIKELLDTRIRPAVAMDGGDITFEGFENGVVYLQMRGACAGCPSSTMTLKSGIENLLKHFIPEVTEVRAVN